MYAETEVQHRSYHCYSGNCKSVLHEYQKICTFYGYILYYVFCLYDTYFSDLFYRKMASATDGNYYLYDCISFAGNDRYSDSAKHGVYIGCGKKPTGRVEPSATYDRCISGIIFNTDHSMGTKIGKICDADKKILPVLLLFGIQFIMILTYMIVCLQGHLKVDYMTAIYLCVEMFENFYIFQVLSELEVREQTKGKLEVMHRRNQEVEQYYQKLTSNLRNITELKEEYETKLKRIYQEFGLEYIPEVHAEQENDAGDIHINSVAENILQKKKEELEKEGIDYRFEFTVPQEFSMDIMELSSLLNNLLDNAQEAVREYRKCAGCENRGFISLQTRVSDGYLILETENSRLDGRKLEMRDDRTYLSSKEEKGHGYGLQIIRKIAEKYQGSMELQENGDRFKNIVRIRMNSLPV